METPEAVIGEDDLEVVDVVAVMLSTDSAISLCRKWQLLCRQLKIATTTICDLERKLNLGTFPTLEAFHRILEIWKAGTGDQATLSTLCDALKSCGFEDIADAVRYRFTKPAIPPRPPYYIQRTISRRVRLKPEIFQDNANDIFVLTGVERYELTLLSGNKPTDVSTNQTKKVTERFILLVWEEDFPQICKKSKAPTHWIERINGKFHWRQSSGSLWLIYLHLDDEQDPYSEKDFGTLLEEFRSTPVCIADTPGMGKTVLLASIANAVEANHPDRLCLFLTLQDLLIKLGKNNYDDKIELKKWILQRTPVSKQKRLGTHMQIELFLDAYDEVPHDQLSRCNSLLKSLLQFDSIRMHVTTRPHLQHELEQVLGVLGFTIQPFDEGNQLDFLRQLWITKFGAEDTPNLTNFAKLCLTKLKENSKEKERDIAGIPLQCLLLADCYSYEAKGYSRGELGYVTSINISSMFDMFDQFMKRKLTASVNHRVHSKSWFAKLKLRRINLKLEEKLLHYHLQKAFQVVFPEFNLNCLKTPKDMSGIQNEVYKLGLLEPNFSSTIPNFVHRTFAEFLIAEYLVRGMSHCPSCRAFLFKQALKSEYGDMRQVPTRTEHFKEEWNMTFFFLHQAISYFVDCQLEKENMEMTYIPRKSMFSSSLLPFYPFLSACIRSNLKYSFHMGLTEKNARWRWDYYLQYLLLLSATYCNDSSIVSKLMIIVKNTDIGEPRNLEFFTKQVEILLNVGITLGSYKQVEFLLTEFGHLCGTLISTEYVRRNCLHRSICDDELVAINKLEIVKLIKNLFGESMDLLDRDNASLNLLYCMVHPALLNIVSVEDVDVNVVDFNGNTVLHLLCGSWETYGIRPTAEAFTKIFNVYRDNGFNLYGHRNGAGQTAIQTAVWYVEVETPVMEQFLTLGGNINSVDLEGNSVLLDAVGGGRSSTFIDNLITRFGVNPRLCNFKQRNVLHIAAIRGNYDALKYFLKNYKLELDVNGKDALGKTPSFYVIANGGEEEMIKLLIEHGAWLSRRE